MTAPPIHVADEVRSSFEQLSAPGTNDLATILTQHRGSLEGLAMSLLRDRAGAQDAVSDVIEAMLRKRVREADGVNVLAYARTCVVNRCRSMLRRQVVARRYLFRQAGAPDSPSADETVLLADEHRHVLDLFYQLPLRQREVMALRYFSQLADVEIADTLGISVSTVRATISRGRAALSRLLEVHPYA